MYYLASLNRWYNGQLFDRLPDALAVARKANKNWENQKGERVTPTDIRTADNSCPMGSRLVWTREGLHKKQG